MKQAALILLMAASAAASAQTPAKPAAPAASAPKATVTAPKSAVPAAHSTAVSSATKLPPGVPPAKGIVKTAFSLHYQDIAIGTGADAEPNKMYKVLYTGWLAADGHKFDSTDDHPRPPVLDKDGKPVLDADGKPKQGDPQPISFPQGFGRVIPGWDQGFGGMKIGGKRRIFIPWQLAYGAKGRPGPDAAHPGIPPKADLIFDVVLVDVSDMPAMPPNHPGMGGMPGGRPMPGGMPPHPVIPGAPPTSPQPGAPATPAAPATAPAASAPPTAPATQPAPTAPAQPAAK